MVRPPSNNVGVQGIPLLARLGQLPFHQYLPNVSATLCPPNPNELLIAYQHRDRAMAERYRPGIYSKNGIVEAVLLVDGMGAGTWGFERLRGEAILRVSGPVDERVTDSDAFFRDRHPVLRSQPLVPEAERTAAAAEAWSRRVIEVLDGHPVNAARAERRLPVFNVITLKWWGRPRQVPTFRERHGLLGTFIAESAFLRGLATAVGLETIEAPETDDARADLRTRLALAAERLDAGDTFVFVHLKATDAAGHTKHPRVKQQTIEQLDAELGDLPRDRAVVCVTGDHATPASPEVIHSGDPVPFVLGGPGVRADSVRSFGELDCAGGILGHLSGADMMPVLLHAADRPLYLGPLPTPFAGAAGYSDILPLLL